jgi:erythromycin esterase-like protein
MTTSSSKSNPKTLQLIQDCAQRLCPNESADFDPILNAIGDAQIVMIGEASHGTFAKLKKIVVILRFLGSHEFYLQRAEITKRLIQEKV